MIKISVIMLTRNSQKHLAKCVDAILMQTYPDFEVIIVDSYSTDNTLSILNNYNLTKNVLKVITSVEDISVGKARMIGAEASKGSILAYIDSDVELPYPNWLENMSKPLREGYSTNGEYEYQLDKLISKEKIAGVQTLAKCRDSDPAVLKRVHASFEYKYDVLNIDHYQIVGTSHLLLRKSVLEDAGGFQDVYSGEDVPVMRKIMELGYSFVYLKNEKCYHHHIDSYKTYILRTLRGYKNRLKNKILRGSF